MDLFAQHAGLSDDLRTAINELIETSALLRHPQLTEFENVFAALHGIEYAIGLTSGTNALLLATQAIVLKAGDEIIVPVNT